MRWKQGRTESSTSSELPYSVLASVHWLTHTSRLKGIGDIGTLGNGTHTSLGFTY